MSNKHKSHVSTGSPGNAASSSLPEKKKKFNSWTRHTDCGTTKCIICDEKLCQAAYSFRCNGCHRHVCSNCLLNEDHEDLYYRDSAMDRVTNGCWRCNYRSGMNPKFAEQKPLPKLRLEEEKKDLESKALGKQRAEEKKRANESQQATIATDTELDVTTLLQDAAAEGSPVRHSLNGAQKAESSRKPTRASLKRKRNVAEQSDTESHSVKRSGIILKLKNQLSGVSAKVKTGGSSEADASKTSAPSLASSHAPLQTARPSDYTHLEGGTTVIIGGGIVGLFIAYELALEMDRNSIEHNITVVERGKAVCELASGSCAGILSTSTMPREWSSITNIAIEGWKDYWTSVESFPKALEDTTSATFDVSASGLENERKIPSWLKYPAEGSLTQDAQTFGQSEPRKVAERLYERCRALNVDFRFRTTIHGVEYSSQSGLSGVSMNTRGVENLETIPCSHLIFAAGPYSTGIFQRLFPEHTVQLENHVQSTNWFDIPLRNTEIRDVSALRFPNGLRGYDDLEDDFTMRVNTSGDACIKISATRKKTAMEDLFFETQARTSKTTHIRAIASVYLNLADVDALNREQCPHKGRAYISTGNHGNPIIDKVGPSALGQGSTDEDDGKLSGVWLCYGFGRFGTTLAPGAARVLVSRMMIGKDGWVNDDFKLPEYNKSKGKAREL